MSDIFISHVEEDAEIGLQIALGLEEAGHSTWCYELDSIPGLSYLLQTGRAIEQCKAIIVLVSCNSLASGQITREIVRAHESGKAFVPVLRNTTHAELQERQPEWREAMGAATSRRIPREGVPGIVPSILEGLKALGIRPSPQPDARRIGRLNEALNTLRAGGSLWDAGRETIAEVIPRGRRTGPGSLSSEIDGEQTFERASAKRLSRRLLIGLSAIAVLILVVVVILVATGGSDVPGGKEEVSGIAELAQFPAPGSYTQGLTWDGTHLWLVDNGGSLFKVDTSGKTLGVCRTPEVTPEGLAWDGAAFWLYTTNYDYVYHFSVDESGQLPQTQVIGSFKSPNQILAGGLNDGLTWDGSSLWYSDQYSLYKLDPSGEVLGSFAFSSEIRGVAWDGQSIWIAYDFTLAKTDNNGVIVLEQQLPTEYSVDALAWGDGCLWIAGSDSIGGESKVFKIIL